MNSLTLGFFYVVGLSWLFLETSLMAGNGSWGPFWLFILGFSVMFSLLGCLPLSDKAVNKIGSIFAIIVGLILLFISLFGDAGGLVNGIKAAVAFVYVVFAFASFGEGKGAKSAEH